MPREPEGYREQLEHLAERYPGKEVLTIQEVCKMFRCNRRKLLSDKTFPVKQFNNQGRYYIPIAGLARWMVSK